jgi:hypothetical protein
VSSLRSAGGKLVSSGAEVTAAIAPTRGTTSADETYAATTCLSGRILDDAGNPAAGAIVMLSDVRHASSVTTATAGVDGRFCLEATRSETPGEDLDDDSKPGKKATVSIRVVAAGQIYDLGEFDTPANQGLCGGPGCLDLGDLRLAPARLRSAALCTVRGTVKHRDGTPAFAAGVEMFDSYVPAETREAICLTAGHSTCKPWSHTEEDGTFSVTAVAMEDFDLGVMGVRQVSPEKGELEHGGRIFSSCPTAPVVLTLDPAYTAVVFLVSVAGNAISWAPEEHGITKLKVTSRAGLKWEIHSAAGKVMRSPLVYGVVPPGATQTYPVHGTPAPVAPGDTVAVWADGRASRARLIPGPAISRSLTEGRRSRRRSRQLVSAIGLAGYLPKLPTCMLTILVDEAAEQESHASQTVITSMGRLVLLARRCAGTLRSRRRERWFASARGTRRTPRAARAWSPTRPWRSWSDLIGSRGSGAGGPFSYEATEVASRTRVGGKHGPDLELERQAMIPYWHWFI